MGKIAQQFSEFKKSTPKHIQWILMGAAFVVIVVLIVLLSGNKETPDIEVIGDVQEDVTPQITFNPENAKLDWAETKIGETKTSDIEVIANTAVRITSVKVNLANGDEKSAGLNVTETCTNEEVYVSDEVSCTITVKYEPTTAQQKTDAKVIVTWHPGLDIGDTQEKTDTAATIIIGTAAEKVIEKEAEKPVPVEQEEPEATETEDDQDEEEPEEDDSEQDFAEDLKQDIAEIAPALPIVETPKPVQKPKETKKEKKISLGTACSDFAFPGYNLQGVQSGWIKPEGGAYYFHPFSDEKCDTPTGVYNAETGFIMDISNKSKKIGSDAEHIRLSLLARLPKLSNRAERKTVHKSRQADDISGGAQGGGKKVKVVELDKREYKKETYLGSGDVVASSRPYDRTFLLRQYKPIPATIVSDIQADPKLLESGIPVRATVDRNVYSDNGRTIIIPTGTLMLGFVKGNLPGPYKAVGRMEIEWYQFIRPDGVEFNFTGNNPFSADSQGRKGVPGHGSTDYLQQFVMPMLTAIVPAAINMIAPIADRFVNQIDLDNNTVVQSGTVRSSELAKNEIINAWNTVATKLMVDMLDNTTPPFSIAAGTRITVFSPVDLLVTCGDAEVGSKKCAIQPYDDTKKRSYTPQEKYAYEKENDPENAEFIGQVRALMMKSLADEYCTEDGTTGAYKADASKVKDSGYDYATLDFYCRSMGTYSAKNTEKQKVVFQEQKKEFSEKYGNNDAREGQFTDEYKKEVLGLEYDEEGKLINPFNKPKPAQEAAAAATTSTITCDGGVNPDANGCCPGETYTDMGDAGMNCCPDAGGDCFPPIQ